MNTTAWRCEAHGTTNAGDCPRCDDELIALAPSPVCQTCKRDLLGGEKAWADDWTVIGPEGARTETRYTCDGCASSPGDCPDCGCSTSLHGEDGCHAMDGNFSPCYCVLPPADGHTPGGAA